MRQTWLGHVACFLSYAIFGVNIVLCKDIAGSDILTPYGLFFLRVVGATALFWLSSAFVPKEHIPRKDMIQIVVASFFGLFLTQMTFLVGIREVSSIDASMISTLSPIFTMFFAAYFIKEPVTVKKAVGVVVSLAGIILLLTNSFYSSDESKSTTLRGTILLLVNCFTFALYLGAFRPLIARYHVVNFMKWMFLFTLIISLPFCTSDGLGFVREASSHHDDATVVRLVWETLYVVVFATFVAYFLIPIGQKHLRPTLVSMYSYMQPVIAVVISVVIGMDSLSWQKDLAIILVFLGVAIVNRSRTAPYVTQHRKISYNP